MHYELTAPGCKRADNGFADAFSAAGDERDFITESHKEKRNAETSRDMKKECKSQNTEVRMKKKKGIEAMAGLFPFCILSPGSCILIAFSTDQTAAARSFRLDTSVERRRQLNTLPLLRRLG